MTDVEIVLADLRIHRHQDSWDWEADYRFAKAIGDTEATQLYQEILKSAAPTPIRIAATRCAAHIHRRRLAALRKLVCVGKVDAWWIGLGPGGRTEFGVTRSRAYTLKSE